MVLEQITQSLLATRDSVIPARPSVRQWEQEPVLTARTIRNQPQVGVNCGHGDRQSTRLNSSHLGNSYAVFCLNDPAPTELSTLSLHDALPIWFGNGNRSLF